MTIALPSQNVAVSGTDRVRALLRCGQVAGPVYLIAGYAQALTRDGFSLKRHPFSFLSLGDLGWIQVLNFVLSGALFIAGAIGANRALRTGRGRTWGPLLIGGMGVGMIAGGVFRADPAFGFPAGAPAGAPDVVSWHGMLHGVAFGVAILCWVGSCVVFAARFAQQRRRGWAALCAATALVLVAPMPLLGSEWGTVALYVVATLGWLWTTAVFSRIESE